MSDNISDIESDPIRAQFHSVNARFFSMGDRLNDVDARVQEQARSIDPQLSELRRELDAQLVVLRAELHRKIVKAVAVTTVIVASVCLLALAGLR